MKERGISLIALIITIIVIIILAAISIAGVSGMVERSRYAKFCGDLDAVQEAVSQAYGTKRIKEAQDPNGLKSSEEIYKWVATGGDVEKLETAEGPDKQELYKLADESVLGLDLPKYGNSDWGVDPKTGEVFLVEGFEYDDRVYYSKTDVQNGGKEKDEEGDGPEEPSEKGVYAKLYNDGTLILSSFNYTDSGHEGVKEDYGTDIWEQTSEESFTVPKWTEPKWTEEYDWNKVIIYDTIYPTDTHMWFYGFQGDTLDLSNLDTSNVTNMSGMFYESQITTLDLSGWNVGNVIVMGSMFQNSTKLTTLNLSNWNTENVEYMESMFDGCFYLTTLEGISKWNTAKVKYMNRMFAYCSVLNELDLSGWDIQPDPDGTDITDMFTMTNLSTVYVRDETVKNLLENGNTGRKASTQIKIKSEETGVGSE